MAGPVGSRSGSGRRRVFVLVDGGIVRGIFNTWDDAEAYADENRFSLDHLMEYETRKDFPDHLHLMEARWGDDWVFQGQWSKYLPKWDRPPEKIRLDHFHFKGSQFELFRQKEFEYFDGIVDRINPMAPDSALVTELIAPKPPSPAGDPGPSLGRLEPAPDEPAEVEEPAGESTDPGLEEPGVEAYSPEYPGIEPDTEEAPPQEAVEPEPQDDSEASDEPESSPEPEEEPIQEPPSREQPKPAPVKLNLAKPPQEPPAEEHEKAEKATGDEPSKPEIPGPPPRKPAISYPESDPEEFSDLKPQPRISFQKKANPLRLKSKGEPQPIPSFKPTSAPPVAPIGKQSSVELAYAQQEVEERKIKEAEEKAAKGRRVWSLRLIFTVIVMVLCWAGGLYWVLRPEPTAASIVSQITSLSSAKVMIFEPDMVFFQLPVDPIHQERWVKSLELKPIPRGEAMVMPTYHALDTWSRPEGFVRPPYSVTEVDEWLDLRTRKIAYGFSLTWEDGSVIILDLESDMLIGWGYAERYPEILN